MRALEQRNAQVLDLEKMAAHRGSVLGNLPEGTQPGQKMFESRIWDALRRFSPDEPVYVEAESSRIGSLRVPDSLISVMRRSPCILLSATTAARVTLLLREYVHFTRTPSDLFTKLDCLTGLHGRKRIDRWKNLASTGDWDAFVRELLDDHYDPAYRKSTVANYPQLPQAMRVCINEGTEEELAALAQRLLDGPHPFGANTVEHAIVAT